MGSTSYLRRPTILAVSVPGLQGGRGIQGPPGVQTGFGFIVYSHAVAGAGDALLPYVRTQLTFSPDAILSKDRLNPPFAGHAFWDGSKVIGRALDDALYVQVNLQVTPEVESGKIYIDLDAG